MRSSDCLLCCRFSQVWLYLLFVLVTAVEGQAQVKAKEEAILSNYDLVPVEVFVDDKWSFETNIIITDSNLLFINVKDLFGQLGILCNQSSTGNSLEGFIENENKTYLIDYTTKQIKVGNITISSKNGVLEENAVPYIETSVLSEAFGLTLTFNVRSLSAKLVASFELPYVKQMRIENTRNNISKLQGQDLAVDTIIPRDYHLFKFGMIDWAINSNQTVNQSATNNVILGLGSELLFGEANISINYNDRYKFDNRQLQYSWRWIDNTNRIIKQAVLGTTYSQSIAFLSAPVIGATVNNSPNTVRKASGTYTINDYTEPNWTVELYINDVLVDYTPADASGLYVFNVPIVYGYTILRLKFYGPLGEERTEERVMNTPYTFIPPKSLEYNLSGGVLQDADGSRFARGTFNYGVNRFLTLGGGLEYLSSIPNSPYIPFAKMAIQPFSKMILNLEYDYGVRMKGLLNYYITKSAFLELDYTKYEEGQQATRFNAMEERKVRISVPFKINRFSGFSKLNFSQFVYESFNFNQLDFVYSAYYKQLSVNSSTLVNWVGTNTPFMTTNLTVSYRMLNGLVLRPSAAYSLNDNRLIRYRAEIEKRVSKRYFGASYERNVAAKSDAVFLNFRYDLPYARTGVSLLYSNKNISFSESAQGSLAFGGDNYTNIGNNASLSKGGILFYPFLDLNQNGLLDKGEKMVLLSTVRVSGGTAVISKKDSIVRVSDLNAFVNYNVEFSNNDLETISWKLKHKTYQILVDPNQYKRVFVPIISMGEVNGMVYLNKEDSSEGLGRVTIQIYDEKGKKVAEVLSEFDGYFSYLGLKPGKYTVRLDDAQLKKLNYQSSLKAHEIFIAVSEEGTIVDGIDFNLKVMEPAISTAKTESGLANTSDRLFSTKGQPEKEFYTSFGKIVEQRGTFYTVQIGVFKNDVPAAYFSTFEPVFYELLPEDEIRYISGKYDSKKQAKEARNKIIRKGVKDAYVVRYEEGKRTSDTAIENRYERTETTFLPAAKAQEKIVGVMKNNTAIEANTEISSKINTSFSRISEQRGLFYSVQIGVFKNYVSSEYLLGFNPVFYELLPDETVRYISGKYDSKKEAKKARNKIISKGVKDAYIVKYKNSKKIDTATIRN